MDSLILLTLGKVREPFALSRRTSAYREAGIPSTSKFCRFSPHVDTPAAQPILNDGDSSVPIKAVLAGCLDTCLEWCLKYFEPTSDKA